MIRRETTPALMGSLALHVAVAAALLISWRHARDIKIGAVVPVTLVSDAPAAELSPAVEAPQTQTAQVDEPTPAAPLEATPPAPQPTPQPPAPQPAPASPKAAPPTPKPQAKTPAKPEKSLDLDALSASVSKMAKSAGAKPSSAAKGVSRPETALQARTGAGSATAAAALSGLAEELQRRWNPNCAVADAREVVVAVTFTLNSGGGVIGEPRAQLAQGAQNGGARAAADRAVSAVYAAAPFRSLPREIYGQPIRVNFDAKKACS